MQCFQFGKLQPVGKSFIGEVGLHIQCPWRLTNKQEIIVGSEDLFEQPIEDTDYDSSFEWDKPMANLRDIKLQKLLDTQQFKVNAVATDHYGGLEIKFDEDFCLTLFPTLSGKDEFLEYWRLLNNKVKPGSHLVVGPLGAEEKRRRTY
ncbi:hypothetical protein GCM10028895_28900 [Pontibacter rugosus]